MSLLDPVIIAQLGNLELRARRILDGFYAGHHVNKNRGHAQDFSEHRPYNPGDDPRSLDWKVFGRTDRLVIKQYEEQTNIQAMVLLDASLSMNFSFAGRVTKLDYAKTLAAALGYLVVSQNDAVGLVAPGEMVPAGTQFGHLSRYYSTLEALQPHGVWNPAEATQNLQQSTRKRGFVIVLSDLMTDEDKMISTLRMLSARKNEVLVFQILDPAEIDLPFEGPVLFEDMESGEQLKTEAGSIRTTYNAWVREKLSSIANVLRTSGIDSLTITTNTPFDKGLGAYLSWRRGNL